MRDILASSLREHIGPRGQAKRAFDSQEDAAIFAAELQTHANASKRRPYRPYECGMCNRWHVGRTPRRNRAR